MNKILLTIALLFIAAFIFGRFDDDVRLLASQMASGAIFFFQFGWLHRRIEDDAKRLLFKTTEAVVPRVEG